MIYYSNSTIFLLTFSSSVLTAAFGIAKFLKMGPCRLIPDEGPPLGGYGQIGFLLIMINVASTILSKGLVLPAIASGARSTRIVLGYTTESKKYGVIVWIFVCLIPNLSYVSLSISNNSFKIPKT